MSGRDAVKSLIRGVYVGFIQSEYTRLVAKVFCAISDDNYSMLTKFPGATRNMLHPLRTRRRSGGATGHMCVVQGGMRMRQFFWVKTVPPLKVSTAPL